MDPQSQLKNGALSAYSIFDLKKVNLTEGGTSGARQITEKAQKEVDAQKQREIGKF